MADKEANKSTDTLDAGQIKTELETLGFDSLDELKEAYAELTKDREKLAADNRKAGEIIKSHGGQIGVLKQQIKELEERLQKGASSPKAPEQTTEQTLEQLEESLSDEQWAEVDKFLGSIDSSPDMTDEQKIEMKRNLAEPTPERAALLKRFKESVKPVPTTLRPQGKHQKKETKGKPTEVLDKLFDFHLQRHRFVPQSPSTATVGTSHVIPEKDYEDTRPVETRVR